MPCISTKRNYGRKKTISGEVKKTIVCQVEHTGMNTTKHQTPAERETYRTKAQYEDNNIGKGTEPCKKHKCTSIRR
jgi:hypothetical protein